MSSPTDTELNPLCTASQLARLRDHVRYAWESSSFFRSRLDEAGFRPNDLRSYQDLIGIPMVTKSELIADQAADPPFGQQRAERSGEPARIYCMAGSQYMWFTEPDLASVARMFSDQFATMGVRQGDIVDISSAFHWVLAGTNFDRAFRDLGASVVPGGPGQSDLRLKVMRQLGVTVFEAFTPYAETLSGRFADAGIDPSTDLAVRLLIIGGELRQAQAKRRLEESWGGAVAREFYGVSEAGMVACECHDIGEGMHLSSECVVEVIDPDTGQHVEPGGPGEIVVTELYRTAQPFIRYRTGDITSGIELEACDCGRATPRLKRILGRNSEEILRVKGQFLVPETVDMLVEGRFGQGTRWQLVIDRPAHVDVIRLRIESTRGADGDDVVRCLVEDFRQSVAMSCDVELVGIGALDAAAKIDDRRTFS